jgi:hypothetical protein
MLSLRRRAQMGVLSACLILVSTLTILYMGSREAVARPQSGNGLQMVNGDTIPSRSATSTKLAVVGH